MTDGASQGLFVVVAIVIFGIFVALSYTVFGSDGLSGGITNLFEQGTEIGARGFGFNNYNWNLIEDLGDQYMLNDDGTQYNRLPSIILLEDNAGQDKVFKVSFDMELIDGNITHIGGHNHMTDFAELRINGRRVPISQEHGTAWNYGAPLDMVVGERVNVEYTFKATLYDNQFENNPNRYIAIQPNRFKYNKTGSFGVREEFHVHITNLKVFEGLEDRE